LSDATETSDCIRKHFAKSRIGLSLDHELREKSTEMDVLLVL